MNAISSSLSYVNTKISHALSKSGRSGEKVHLIAVSKTRPASDIAEVLAAGHNVFGENRVQEAEGKKMELPDQASWHLIGGLQKNKVRKALSIFDCIQTIDSLALAERVGRVAGEMGLCPKVFLQCNLAAEEQKGGFLREQLLSQIEAILSVPNIDLVGLMAIPPMTQDPEEARRHFAELREFRDVLEAAAGRSISDLSMGMSSDYQVAVEEGATHVRVGSRIFGARD